MDNAIRRRPLRRAAGLACVVAASLGACGTTARSDRDASPTPFDVARATIDRAAIPSQRTQPTRSPSPTAADAAARDAHAAPRSTHDTATAARPSGRPARPVATTGNAAVPATTSAAVPATTIQTQGAGRPDTAPTPPPSTTMPTTQPPTTLPVPPATSAPPTTAPATAAPPTTKPAAPAPPASDALSIVNGHRAAAGLAALVEDRHLADAAQAHSLDQAARQSMTHTGSDGSNAGDRIARAGFAASTWAENVAAGYGTASAAIDGWMHSSGHRDNILGTGFTAVGVASARASDGTLYWTMVLAG